MLEKIRGRPVKCYGLFLKKSAVIVQGMNVQKRHQKTKKDTKQGGGIIDVFAPIHVSNVQLIDPKDNKPTRIGIVTDETTNKNVRIAKKSGTILKK